MENVCSIERPPQVAAGWSGAPGRLALSQAWITFLGGTGQQQEQALAQLVSGTDRLIEQEQDVRGSDWVAQQRAALHAMLMRLVRSLPVHSALRRAALWHSRLSHESLVAHLQEHGPSPVIDEALRAGCLVLRLPGSGAAALTH